MHRITTVIPYHNTALGHTLHPQCSLLALAAC